MATPSETAFNISPDQLSSLSYLSTLLHLFLNRNKNQHRRSIWFRHFSVFRRNLAFLLQDLESLNTIPTSHAARAKKKLSDPILISRIRVRLDHWRDILVPKWHHAFSQLIADQRFSVLGLFLMGVLAEVCQIVGLIVELEEMGHEEVRRAIEAFGSEESGLIGLGKAEEADDGMREDAGEIIAREDRREEVSQETIEVLPPATGGEGVTKSRKRAPDAATEERRKKKKRKKVGGDAIDDIFG
ncbi:hypothetical protein Slin15195_G046080 [Septoria linicola]|uniref:RNase MRP protein 1 RNA binding domain-containing protein n=1 Tax=Septoria linicola TaxID=215465 RepID=A0A9Q9AL36_9PEZI|nr:hypothetical protein Slin14017_G049610 [Septoria linicola]USW51289.1 hypothetical protein Slin15195_G046080 [Septoria linicola]